MNNPLANINPYAVDIRNTEEKRDMNVTVSKEEYEAMTTAVVKFNLIKTLVEEDTSTYGLSADMTDVIKTILDIKKDAE